MVIQNCQSSSDKTRNGLPLLRSLSFYWLLLAVDGLPGISLWALAIVGAIVMFCIQQVLSLLNDTKFGDAFSVGNRWADHYLLCIDIFSVIYVKLIALQKISGFENQKRNSGM